MGHEENIWGLFAAWETLLEAQYGADRLALQAVRARPRSEPVPSLFTPESGPAGLAPVYALALEPAASLVDATASDDLCPID